jgi:hypothetical protein
MKDQHEKIAGYRDLSQAEIDLINTIKAKGSELQDLVWQVQAAANVDARWVSIGKTDLQTGLMALLRAIAKPDGF